MGFVSHELRALAEGMLILLVHAILVIFALVLAWGVHYIQHALEDPHVKPTVLDAYFAVGVNAAERILAFGLIAFGTGSALWTFAKRRKE